MEAGDWISVLAVAIAVLALALEIFDRRRSTELQERLARIEEDRRREEVARQDAETQDKLRAHVIGRLAPDDEEVLEVANRGPAVAHNVVFRVYEGSDQETRKVVLEWRKPTEIHTEAPFRVRIPGGSGVFRDREIHLEWVDESGEERSRKMPLRSNHPGLIW